mmetsp:Transcript_13857/g.18429  ORF Transcript_13857/g.18429 Transcript_13857/m.18429 type:complete len:211 (+) Transcript_13857:721-1353(+)
MYVLGLKATRVSTKYFALKPVKQNLNFVPRADKHVYIQEFPYNFSKVSSEHDVISKEGKDFLDTIWQHACKDGNLCCRFPLADVRHRSLMEVLERLLCFAIQEACKIGSLLSSNLSRRREASETRICTFDKLGELLLIQLTHPTFRELCDIFLPVPRHVLQKNLNLGEFCNRCFQKCSDLFKIQAPIVVKICLLVKLLRTIHHQLFFDDG